MKVVEPGHIPGHVGSPEAKAVARAFMVKVRATTKCQRCGRQPVDFHNPAHEARPSRRVARLAAMGYPIARIQAEIDASEPLCRRCHMKEDGR